MNKTSQIKSDWNQAHTFYFSRLMIDVSQVTIETKTKERKSRQIEEDHIQYRRANKYEDTVFTPFYCKVQQYGILIKTNDV